MSKLKSRKFLKIFIQDLKEHGKTGYWLGNFFNEEIQEETYGQLNK